MNNYLLLTFINTYYESINMVNVYILPNKLIIKGPNKSEYYDRQGD